MMLSEIHQIEIDKYCILSLVYGLLNMKQTNITKQLTVIENKLVVPSGEEGREEGQNCSEGLRSTNYYI